MVTPYYEDEWATIYHGRAEEVLPALGAVDAIFTDPPYFRVKGEWWDRQWDDAERFLGWLGDLADEWRRMLAMNGSLYCWASPKMAARVEVILSERFHILNRIRWVKSAGWHQKAEVEAQRRFLSPWEECIFAEHHGQDQAALGGWVAKCDDLRGSVFEPLRAWMVDELSRTGWTKADLNEAMGFAPHGMADSRYFGRSQWQLPTAEHYAKIRQITGGFRREYEDLRREYEDLRREYEDLRRPFAAAERATDVWDFAPVMDYPGKHPCEKPEAMIRHALAISTKPDALVLDCFMGSGSTLRAAKDLGRRAIGVEVEERYCEIAARRLSQEVLDLGGVA